MTRATRSKAPGGDLLNTALEEQRIITQLLKGADEKTVEAAELRTYAVAFELDATSLREDAARRQARMQTDILNVSAARNADGMVAACFDVQDLDKAKARERKPQSMKLRSGAVVSTKNRISIQARKDKQKRTRKTRAQQQKTADRGACPEQMTAEKKRSQRNVDLIKDLISGALIIPSNGETPGWLPRHSREARRDNGAAYSKAYFLRPGELPMMSGGVLTTTDYPNFDASRPLGIETHVHMRSKEQDAADARRSCQFITVEEARTDGILTDNEASNSGSDKELAFSEEDTVFATEDFNGGDLPMPTCNDVSSQWWFNNSQDRDIQYNSQIGVSQRRLLNCLL